MMKKWLMQIVFALLVPLTAHAAQPTSPVPRTGQELCYLDGGLKMSCDGRFSGQDGSIRAGVAWPSPRFIDNGDQTQTDKLTGLIWSKNAYPAATTKTWQGALDYIKSLNSSSYLGHNDWRLPNINELKSLVNQGQSFSSVWLTGQGFTAVQSKSYWSSTTAANYTGAALYVRMNSGDVNGISKDYSLVGYNGYVWPVRSGQSGAFGSLILSKTGQTACYDASGATIACSGTGQDGELQTGASWPATRFSANSDQTVSDGVTGLIWSKNAYPAATTKTWQGAQDYIKSLNSSSYLGHNDWRLPNINELVSLANWGVSDKPDWLNGQGFTAVQAFNYWSSTTYAVGTLGGTRSFNMTGYTEYGYAGCDYYVWPVRSGQSGAIDSFSLSVTKSGIGTGTVSSSTGGISCGTTCSASITTGTSVTLSAAPSSGSTFTGWTGACSGTGTCTVTMDVTKSVTATFTLALASTKPGDCDNNGTVTIAEVQSAINMFLGLKTVEACVDLDSAGGVSVAEVQEVINSFLGL